MYRYVEELTGLPFDISINGLFIEAKNANTTYKNYTRRSIYEDRCGVDLYNDDVIHEILHRRIGVKLQFNRRYNHLTITYLEPKYEYVEGWDIRHKYIVKLYNEEQTEDYKDMLKQLANAQNPTHPKNHKDMLKQLANAQNPTEWCSLL